MAAAASAPVARGHDDGLHEHVQFDVARPALAGRRPHPRHRVVEASRLPTDLVALSVLPSGPEHGRRDDVGVSRRMGEGAPAVDPDEQRYVVLEGCQGPASVEVV